MSKIKINDIAKEIGIPSKIVLSKAQELKLDVKSGNSSIDESYALIIMDNIMNNKPMNTIEEDKSKPQASIDTKEEDNKNTMLLQKNVVIIKKKNEVVKNKEPNKKKKTTAISKKKVGINKIEMKDNTNVSDRRQNNDGYDIYIDHQDDVMLLDLNDVLNEVDNDEKNEEYTQKKKQNNKNNINKKPIFNRPFSPAKRKSKKVYKDKTQVIEDEIIKIPEDIRVYEFAQKANKPLGEVIKVLFNLGMIVNKNDFLDKDSIDILSEEFDLKVETVDLDSQTDLSNYYNEDSSSYKDERPPIVTIMGHVDHGKTTLLDTIRKTKKVEEEAGGITQHISSYTITLNNQDITFIDTPGHEAFNSIRDRSTNISDIVIIVVASDDGLKPQTKESLDFVKKKKSPFIVAVNKMDKEGSSMDKVKTEFSDLGFIPSDWGGDIDFLPISALKNQGIDKLLENIIVQAELLELKANNNDKAKAVVLESYLNKSVGINSTILVQNGTLNIRDIISVGSAYGKVKRITDDNNNTITEVKPGYTANIFGLNNIPISGSLLVVCDDEKKAKALANKRYEYEYNKKMSATTKVTMEDLNSFIEEGKKKALSIILKTDTQGALEAITNSIEKLNNDEVKAIIVHSSVGTITENDLSMANYSNTETAIIGFNVKPTTNVKNMSTKNNKINLNTFNTIYDIIEYVNKKLVSMMDKVISYKLQGKAEIREIFKAAEVGNIAGSMVVDGTIKNGSKVKLMRNDEIVLETYIKTLKRFKDNAKEVNKGLECGITLEDNSIIQIGDEIESYEKVEEEATL